MPNCRSKAFGSTAFGPRRLDIGSNVGFHTFNWSRTHDVFAFEPFERNLRLQNLTRCLEPALAARIRLYPIGLSRKASRCELYQIEAGKRANVGDTHSVCGDDEAQLAAERAPILKMGYAKLGESRVATLDAIAPRSLYGREKVLKIDVEGYEYNALLGAQKLMSTGRPPRAVHAEVMQLGADKRKFFEMMRGWGYEPRDVRQPNSAAADDAKDVLFVLGEERQRKSRAARPQHNRSTPDAVAVARDRHGAMATAAA